MVCRQTVINGPSNIHILEVQSWKTGAVIISLSVFLINSQNFIKRKHTHTQINFAYKGSCFVVIFAEMFISEKKDKAHLE